MMSVQRLAGTWAVVPVKRLDRAKSRLAADLSSAQRVQLAEAMLQDVLDVLATVPGLSGTLVVTDDPVAVSFVRQRQMLVLPDPAVAETNDAVRHGLAWLSERGAAAAVVIPGDVPFVSAEEIGAVLHRLRAVDVVLVPAARDGGTNMLAVSPPGVLPVAYGGDSFERHRRAALRAGLEIIILHLAGAGHDIDVASDLLDAGSRRPPNRTSALLGSWHGQVTARGPQDELREVCAP